MCRDTKITKCVGGICVLEILSIVGELGMGTWIYSVVKMFPLVHPDLSEAGIIVVDYV